MTATLPPAAEQLLSTGQREPFLKAYDAAIYGGSSMGAAMLAGFQAVEPKPVIVAKFNLETTDRLWEVFSKDAEAQVFYAWASVVEKDGVEVVDHDGDSWSPADMEKAAWNFASAGGTHGNRHVEMTGSELVASMPFTKDLQDALGINLGRVGWLVGFRVHDDALWSDIRDGRLPMVSIGASGMREAVS